MKKTIFVVCLILAMSVSIVSAATYPSSNYGVVPVGVSPATLVYQGETVNQSQSVGVFIQNQSPTLTVYCGPAAAITTSTAPIQLQAGAGFNFEYSGVPIYCLTASSTANVGYMELPKGN